MIAARGDPTESRIRWQLADGGGGASTDDITIKNSSFRSNTRSPRPPPTYDDDVELLQWFLRTNRKAGIC